MKLTVEPLLGLATLYGASYSTIQPQYIYQQVADKYGLVNYTSHDVCANSTDDPSTIDLHQLVSAHTSSWVMYINLAQFLSSIFVVLPLSTWGDHVGRRSPLLISFVSFFIENLICCLTITYNLPLYLLLAAAFTHGIGGGFSSILASSFAYIADISDHQSRTLRIAIGETFLGVGGFSASLYTGYWIKSQGFSHPLWFSLGLNFVAIFYIIFILGESKVIDDVSINKDDDVITSHGCSRFCHSFKFLFTKKPYIGILRSLQRETNHLKILPQIFVIFLQCCYLGGNLSVATIYKETFPFCWSSTLIGYVASLSSLSFFFSLFAIKYFHHKLGDSWLLVVAILSSTGYLLFEAFSTQTWMLIAGTCISLFGTTLITILRSWISRNTDAQDQGSYFAMIALSESCGYFVGSLIFNNIYSATLHIYRGIVFIVGVAIQFIIFVILCCTFFTTNERGNYEEI